MSTTVLLRSSGIDSHCISYLYQPDIEVYYNLGAEYNRREIETLPEEVIIDNSIRIGGEILPNDILPRRNAFLVLAAAYYGDTIVLGTTAGDTTKDKDSQFVAHMNTLLAYMGSDEGKATPANVITPFAHMTKTELVSEYILNGGDIASLIKTRSCYDNMHEECGACRSCIRKYVALRLNDVDCNDLFIENPLDRIEVALEYAIKQNRGSEIEEIRRVIEL